MDLALRSGGDAQGDVAAIGGESGIGIVAGRQRQGFHMAAVAVDLDEFGADGTWLARRIDESSVGCDVEESIAAGAAHSNAMEDRYGVTGGFQRIEVETGDVEGCVAREHQVPRGDVARIDGAAQHEVSFEGIEG